VYDWFLTLDQEARLVWRSKFSTVKLMYILTRYSAFIDMSMNIYCTQLWSYISRGLDLLKIFLRQFHDGWDTAAVQGYLHHLRM